MRCSNCQNEITPGATFCRHCGAHVETPFVSNSGNFKTEIVRETSAPAENNSGNKNVVLIVLVSVLAALLAVAIVAIIFLVPAKSGEKESSQVVVTEPVEAPVEKAVEKPVEKSAEESGYVCFFKSDTQYITESDLAGLGQEEVAMIRNEIYARHGYMFKTEPYKSYFESRPWYVPNPYFSEADFNEIEMANKEFLIQYEKDRGWR